MGIKINSFTNFTWKENLSAEEWDGLLAKMKGNPLQSSVWGNARKKLDQITDYRWAIFHQDTPIYLIRFEERRLFKFFKIAWAPQGPIENAIYHDYKTQLKKSFLKKLNQKKFFICVTNPWKKTEIKTNQYTLQIDLTKSKDLLWSKLNKQFRNEVRRAKKEGVIIKTLHKPEEIAQFYALCQLIGKRKGFELNTSPYLMTELLEKSNQGVESYLFGAYLQQTLCAGAFIMRCGTTLHYLSLIHI